MHVVKPLLAFFAAAAATGCAPYNHDFYDIDVPGRQLSNRCGIPETAKFAYHGLDIRVGINVISMSPAFTLLVDVPEGLVARFVSDVVTIHEPLDSSGLKINYQLRTFNSEYTGIASAIAPMIGKSFVHQNFFGEVTTQNTFFFGLLPEFRANEVKGLVTLPSMDINGTTFPPLIIPYRKTSKFVFASLNGC